MHKTEYNTIKLKFIATDFTETSYINADDCAITRALRRAGYDMKDTGCTLASTTKDFAVSHHHIENIKPMLRKVERMYSYLRVAFVDIPVEERIKPKAFQATIKIPLSRGDVNKYKYL